MVMSVFYHARMLEQNVCTYTTVHKNVQNGHYCSICALLFICAVKGLNGVSAFEIVTAI